MYAKQRKRLMKFHPAQAQSRYTDVYATFEASAAVLEASDEVAAQDALQLLAMLAMLSPSRVPLSLFEIAWWGAQSIQSGNVTDDSEDLDCLTPRHVLHLLPLIQTEQAEWDAFRLVEAVNELKAFSLVSVSQIEDKMDVSMHLLTHAWAKDRQNRLEHQSAWLTTGCVVAVSMRQGEFWRRQARELQPHLQTLLSMPIQDILNCGPQMMVVRVLLRCGWHLNELRDDKALFMLMYELLESLGLDLKIVDKWWLSLYDLLGQNLHNFGRVKEAVALLEQVVKISEQTLVEDHPDRLASQHELAMAYRANGQVKKAVALLEQVVKIRERTLVEDHPSRLASQHALAMAYRASGQVKEAVTLLEQVVKIREQTLVEDHLSRLASQHELASAYRANGQVKEAVALLEQVVKIEEQTLVEDHPDRLASQQLVAIIYWDLDCKILALRMMRDVVMIEHVALDSEHPRRKQDEEWLTYFENELEDLAASEEADG